MRKLIYTIIILVILLTTSCSSNDDRYETLDAKDVFFTYPADKVRAFAVDEDGSVYALEDKTVTVFDLNGQRISDFELISDSSINYICLGDDVLYFTSKAMDETETLYRYDLKSKQQEELISLDCFSKLKQMAYLNGNIYFSGISPDYINKQYDLWEGDEGSFNPFVYDGTVFAAYKVDEDHLDLVFDETPIGFAVTPEEELMIYAYDNEGGYYFAKLDLKNGGIEDKHYTAINDIMSFAVDSKGGIILWPSASKTSFFNTLSYLSYKDDRVVADVMPNVIALPDGIKYVKGFTFYYNIISNRIERIKNSVYVKDNPKIKIISAGNYTTDAFSAGYQVEFTDLDYEEFAMTVLSLDKNYDICYMNSRQDFSLNIKNKGSFYPLNDVPYVKEFIDSCFPYIKEAATDDNGDIWMIPIDISVPVVILSGGEL